MTSDHSQRQSSAGELILFTRGFGFDDWVVVGTPNILDYDRFMTAPRLELDQLSWIGSYCLFDGAGCYTVYLQRVHSCDDKNSLYNIRVSFFYRDKISRRGKQHKSARPTITGMKQRGH